MAPYWRNYYRNRWRRRRRPRYRRSRSTLRWRRRYYRHPFWVRKKFKLKSIKLKQWQPKTIRNCKVKGIKPLFQGSADRLTNNYWQYPISFVPPGTPGGGGWGIMALSLSSIYEDYQHLQNIFTASNAGLPLVRYKGVRLTFYQHQYTDYVVEVDNCWPMLDTPLKHPNSQPARMLMSKKKIIMPSIETKPLKKRKKSIFVTPPSQMLNKWYFQKDICNTKLVMITASACSLISYFLPNRATSNNCTIWALNTHIFKNADFQHPSTTTGYQPRNNTYMYSSTATWANLSKENLIYLGDCKNYKPGQPGDIQKKDNWGNPFHKDYINNNRTVYLGTKPPTDQGWTATTTSIQQTLQEMHSPIAYKMRYNPDRDTGEGNTAYFVDNYRTAGDNGFAKPGDPNRVIDGFPLWIMLWGWPDWIKKLAEIHRVDDDYILVIQTSFFTENLPYYVLLDDSFINGKSYYDTPQSPKDLLNWYPKFYYQQQSVENICKTGPGVSRISSLLSVQAKMKYQFYFKWGGCPAVLEKVYDPCSQGKWPIPSDFNEGFQIQNPDSDPSKEIYSWDFRKDFITEPAIKRLKKDSISVQLPCLSTGSRSDVQALKTQKTKEHQETSSEEEETTLNLKLLRLRQRQQQLHKQLLKLITS
nr:MAG: ORF1 [TTV-like mini virus]